MKALKVYLVWSIVALVSVYLIGCDGGSSHPASAKKEVNQLSESTPLSAEKEVAQLSESTPPAITKLAPILSGGKCNMDSVNGADWSINPKPFVAAQNDTILIRGWGVDEMLKRIPSSVFLRVQLGERILYSETKNMERVDVAKYFNEEYYKNSGFQANVSLSHLSPGEYQLMIVMTFPDKAILCSAGRVLVVK